MRYKPTKSKSKDETQQKTMTVAESAFAKDLKTPLATEVRGEKLQRNINT